MVSLTCKIIKTKQNKLPSDFIETEQNHGCQRMQRDGEMRRQGLKGTDVQL